MNYIETEAYSNCCTEWQFYYNKILGDAGITPLKRDLITYLITPTYYNDNTVYFDYRGSIINTLITSNITNYKTASSYVLQMKQDEDNYIFNTYPTKNEYSIYDVIFLVARINNWSIDGQLLLDIRATQYNTNLIITNKYEALKQLDIYLNTNIADTLFGLYQRTYIIR